MEYTDKEYCLEVWGDWACFTRPELKVERVSYDVITPSAARAIFEAILFKRYAMRWQVTKIEVINPIRWTSVRRNEVGALAGRSSIYIEDKRQQKNSLLLKDVRYRIYNPQNEMFWHFRTKCSFPKTKRTSLILFLFITYNKKASKKNVFLRCFLLCYL